jgi:transcription elongation factor GreA
MARKVKKIQSDDAVMVTQHGYDLLIAELEERKVLREAIAKEIDEARDLGDLSENASYKEAMERKDLNENRIEELEALLSKVSIVKESQHDTVVTIGRSVEIKRTSDNSKKVITLVGSTEADPLKNKVSIESPLGKAILNSHIGDSFTLNLPTETVEYKITKFAA